MHYRVQETLPFDLTGSSLMLPADVWGAYGVASAYFETKAHDELDSTIYVLREDATDPEDYATYTAYWNEVDGYLCVVEITPGLTLERCRDLIGKGVIVTDIGLVGRILSVDKYGQVRVDLLDKGRTDSFPPRTLRRYLDADAVQVTQQVG